MTVCLSGTLVYRQTQTPDSKYGDLRLPLPPIYLLHTCARSVKGRTVPELSTFSTWFFFTLRCAEIMKE
jgi:hypothetical protein